MNISSLFPLAASRITEVAADAARTVTSTPTGASGEVCLQATAANSAAKQSNPLTIGFSKF